MIVTLKKLTPKINKEPFAFADFEIAFTPKDKIILKGVQVRFHKSKMVICLPKFPHEDKKKMMYSPFLFDSADKAKEFIEAAKEQIIEKYPLSKWQQGGYDGR